MTHEIKTLKSLDYTQSLTEVDRYLNIHQDSITHLLVEINNLKKKIEVHETHQASITHLAVEISKLKNDVENHKGQLDFLQNMQSKRK